MVAAAGDHVTGGAASQFGQIGLGDLRQLEIELTRQLGHVPEHVPQLQLEGLAHLGRELAALITQHLLHLVSHLAGFTAEPQGGVDGIAAHIGVLRRGAGPLLIRVEIHWHNRAGGPR